MKWLIHVIALTVCGISIFLYLPNFLHSPAWDKTRAEEQAYVRKMEQNRAPDMGEEKILAEAYWFRYPDVRENEYWGENSIMGIRGPREHYRLYGRQEGRIYGPISRPSDMEKEKELANAYWQRYPDIAGNEIWGRSGSMGLLGARDHYQYFGKKEGRIWGVQETR